MAHYKFYIVLYCIVLTQTKLCHRFDEDKMQKLDHVSSTLTLQKNQMQEMTSHITDLSVQYQHYSRT